MARGPGSREPAWRCVTSAGTLCSRDGSCCEGFILEAHAYRVLDPLFQGVATIDVAEDGAVIEGDPAAIGRDGGGDGQGAQANLIFRDERLPQLTVA